MIGLVVIEGINEPRRETIVGDQTRELVDLALARLLIDVTRYLGV
jgi:hypothetical protein